MAHHCISTKPSETGEFVRTLWLLSSNVASFVYAILLMLAFSCFKALRKRKSGSKWVNRCLIAYVVSAALVGGVALALEINKILQGVVLDVACIGARLQQADPYKLRGVLVYISINLMTDGLLVWRCYAVSRGLEKGRWSVLFWVIPLFVYIALVGVDIAVVVICTPRQLTGKGLRITFSLLFGISAFLNALITSIIVILLFRYRRMITRAVGEEHQLPFLRIIPVLIESAALIVIVDIFVIVAATRLGTVADLATQLWVHAQPIASLLIIDRISRNSDYFTQTTQVTQTLDTFADSEPSLSSPPPSEILVIGKDEPVTSNV